MGNSQSAASSWGEEGGGGWGNGSTAPTRSGFQLPATAASQWLDEPVARQRLALRQAANCCLEMLELICQHIFEAQPRQKGDMQKAPVLLLNMFSELKLKSRVVNFRVVCFYLKLAAESDENGWQQTTVQHLLEPMT